MSIHFNKNTLLFLPVLLIISALVISLIPNSAFASRYSDTTDLKQKVAMYDYGLMLYGCFLQNDGVETNGSKVENGQLFYFGPGVSNVGAVSFTPQIVSSVSDLGDDNYTYCGQNDGQLSKSALSSWGVSGLDLVCAMGYKREGNGSDCKQSTDKNFQAWGGINGGDSRANAFKRALNNLVGVNIDSPGDDVAYVYWRNYVVQGCTTGRGVPADQTSVSGDLRYELQEISGTGQVTTVYSGGNKKSDYPKGNNRGNIPNNVTCGTALNNANGKFAAYFKAITEKQATQACQQAGYQNVPGGSFPGKNDLTACIQGSLNKGVDGFCESTYPDYSYQGAAISRDSERKACAFGQGRTLDYSDQNTGNLDDPGQQANTTSCALQGIGWIVCPLTTAMAGITDSLYGWIQNFLKVQPLNINIDASDNTTYIAWSSMRTFANLVFVIVFLIIIFSQLTGSGVSNYGVKKMLPRLVVAAILVNISYWVAAIAVDVFNILGSGVYAIVRNLPLGNISITDNIWETVLGWLLAGGAGGSLAIGGYALLTGAAAGTLTAAMWIAIVFVLGAVLALVIAFLILAARQALIIVLIIIAPLAFVAYILPNTEKYFTLWRKALTTLLLFYPLFALLFSGSYIVGMIIIGSAGQANDEAAVGMTVILGMAVMVVPLAITPLIMRFSTGVLGTVAGMINNKNKGLIDRARKVRDRKNGLAVNEAFGQPGRRNPFSRVYRRMQSSARGDAQRQKIVDANNAATYGRTNKGTDLSLGVNLAQQQEELVGAEHKAEFDEMKSNKDPILVNAREAAKIRQARTAQEGIEVANSRVGSARSVLQTRMSERYNTDASLVTEAAGIGGQNAESRIRAAAVSTIIEESNKAIAAERTTMSKMAVGYDHQTDKVLPGGLFSEMTNISNSAERRAAAASQIMKTGGDGDIHKTLDYLSSISGTGEEASTIQQQVAADIGGRKPLALGAADMANMGRGQYKGNFQQKILGRISAGKVSADALHGASADELQEFVKAIPQLGVNDPQRAILKKAIADYKSNVNYRPPADEIARSINDIQSRL